MTIATEIVKRFDEQHEFINSRASKESLRDLKKLVYVLITIMLLIVAGGLNSMIKTARLETEIEHLVERQHENIQLLNEIGTLLRAGQ